MSRYTTTTYEEVRVKATRRGPCPGCGKSVNRSRTFSNTVSPFNKNPGGTIRTRAEVRERVQGLADAWSPSPAGFWHERCASEATPSDGGS